MIGSKYLSELVDCSEFQKGKLNLIEAPTGCGKTAFALKYFPTLVENPLYKVAFLIDTTNGKEQAAKKYNSELATFGWQESVKAGMIDFGNSQRCPIMTYYTFGMLCKKDTSFIDKLDYIFCDELPSLFTFKNIGEDRSNHQTAEEEIKRAIQRGNVTVIAMTATPQSIYKNMSDCIINPIKVDKEQLRRFETKQIVEYNSLKTVFSKVSKGEIGLCYAKHIRTMQRIEAMAVTAGLSPICVWSIRNAGYPMTEEQLAVRKEVLENSRIPPQYNLLIINASSETSIKIESMVDYVIVHSTDEDARVQVRGRVNRDLTRLYLLSSDALDIEVAEKFLNCKLFAEGKKELCEDLHICKNSTEEDIFAWTGVKPRLIKAGYVLKEGRENNKRYVEITLPE